MPAAILLFGRLDSKQLFNDPLDMLPNQDQKLSKPKRSDFLQVIWADPIKRRATIFAWISNACQGAEFTPGPSIFR